MDLKNVLDRIEQRLQDLGISEAEASRRSVGNFEAIRNVRRSVGDQAKAKKGLTLSTLMGLARGLETTEEWLLHGRGPKRASDTATERGDVIDVPLISWVSAGNLSTPDAIADLKDAPPVAVPDLDASGEWIALRVEGDSMDRISPPDSIIVVNLKDRRLVANACYVIADEDGAATYKRYRPPNEWAPVSTNPAHKPLRLTAGAEPRIIGRVRKSILSM